MMVGWSWWKRMVFLRRGKLRMRRKNCGFWRGKIGFRRSWKRWRRRGVKKRLK
jgi:hypothetical protein